MESHTHMQTGGLYLKKIGKRGFKPILDMIHHPSSTLKNLTYDSLKGFMVVLTIDSQHSEYNSLSGTSPRTFTKPVTDYLLKISIITETEKNIGRIKNVSKSSSSDDTVKEGEDIGILKYSETKESFIEEAKIQQKIWYTSLSNGKEQLCPSIANFSLFTNKNSKRLMNIMKNKTKDEILKHIIFKWIYDTLDSDRDNELGIITMPLIQKSTTFDTYLDSYENGKLPKRDFLMAIESFLLQILRLWIDHRIYHADLHANNSLIYKDDYGEIKCVIIDFGRIIDFTEFNRKYQDEDGLTRNFFILLNERIERKNRELNFTLLSNSENHPLTTLKKIDGIESLYKDVYDFDSMYYQRGYGLVHGNSYDYYKAITSLPSSEKNELFERVYNKLYKMFSVVDKHDDDGQNIDFFIKNKERFVFIVNNNTAQGYGTYYYSLKGYNGEREKKRNILNTVNVKQRRMLRRRKSIIGRRNDNDDNNNKNKNNFIKRFFLTRKNPRRIYK